MRRIYPSPKLSVGEVSEQGRIDEQLLSDIPSYIQQAGPSIQCQLISWANHSGNPEKDTAHGQILKGVGNIITHVNSVDRTRASEAFDEIQGTAARNTGSNSRCRI